MLVRKCGCYNRPSIDVTSDNSWLLMVCQQTCRGDGDEQHSCGYTRFASHPSISNKRNVKFTSKQYKNATYWYSAYTQIQYQTPTVFHISKLYSSSFAHHGLVTYPQACFLAALFAPLFNLFSSSSDASFSAALYPGYLHRT
jgi:hypothetical protein